MYVGQVEYLLKDLVVKWIYIEYTCSTGIVLDIVLIKLK